MRPGPAVSALGRRCEQVATRCPRAGEAVGRGIEPDQHRDGSHRNPARPVPPLGDGEEQHHEAAEDGGGGGRLPDHRGDQAEQDAHREDDDHRPQDPSAGAGPRRPLVVRGERAHRGAAEVRDPAVTSRNLHGGRERRAEREQHQRGAAEGCPGTSEQADDLADQVPGGTRAQDRRSERPGRSLPGHVPGCEQGDQQPTQSGGELVRDEGDQSRERVQRHGAAAERNAVRLEVPVGAQVEPCRAAGIVDVGGTRGAGGLDRPRVVVGHRDRDRRLSFRQAGEASGVLPQHRHEDHEEHG